MLRIVNLLTRNITPILFRSLQRNEINSGFSKYFSTLYEPNIAVHKKSLLNAVTFSVAPSRGMKMKGFVKKRCKDCYLLAKNERLYNYCKVHPRHNQMSKRSKDRVYFVLTSVETKTTRKW